MRLLLILPLAHLMQTLPGVTNATGFRGALSVFQVVYVPSGQVHTGAAMDGENEDFVIEAVGEVAPISLETLFKEMTDSVADLEIVRRRIADSSWAPVFLGPQARLTLANDQTCRFGFWSAQCCC
jgi:hypothetical protein